MDMSDIWAEHVRAIVDREAPGIGRGVKRRGYVAVATATGSDEEYVYQVYTGRKKPGESFAKAVARAYADGREVTWINYPAAAESSGFSVAQPVSHETVTIPLQSPGIPVILWGDMDSQKLPGVFRVEAPDDSMAERVRRGWMVEFDRSLVPRQDDGVLVEDFDGRWYFRLFSQGAMGRFQAFPLNRQYQTLDSERDGLKVLAVLIGVPQRWAP